MILNPGFKVCRRAKAVVVLWSPRSVVSRWVRAVSHRLPAPLSGLPPVLAREGAAHLLDIGTRGFTTGPCKSAVIAYLASGQGRLEWSAFDELDHAWPDPERPPLWRVTFCTTDEVISLEAGWKGPDAPPSARLALVFPASESREISINGSAISTLLTEVPGVTRRLADWRP